MKKKKLLTTAMSMALVGVVAVGGTLAYLSDKSNEVKNTFNVGNGYEEEGNHVGLWLDEALWGSNEGTRTESGNTYEDLLPGSVVVKDPTFHMTANSTDSYVFAYVQGVDDMIKAGYIFTVEDPAGLTDPVSAFNEHWVKVSDYTDEETFGFDGLYVYVVDKDATSDAEKYGVVSTKTSEVDPAIPGTEMEPIFNFVKLGSSVDNAKFSEIEASDVVIKGAAVQTANLSMVQAEIEAIDVIAGAAALG